MTSKLTIAWKNHDSLELARDHSYGNITGQTILILSHSSYFLQFLLVRAGNKNDAVKLTVMVSNSCGYNNIIVSVKSYIRSNFRYKLNY